MNPFTQEQIQRGKNFSQEERSNFDAFVASGTDPVKAFEMTLSLSGKQTDSDLKGAENIFKSALSTVQSPFRGIGEGIGNIIAQPFVNRQQQEVQAQGENLTQQLLQRLNQARQAGNQSEVDRYTRALQWVDTGAGITDEFAKNLPSNREVIGSALQTAGIVGGFGLGGATGSLARQAGIGAAQEAGAGAIIGLGSGLSDTNATAGDIARDTLMGAGLGAAVGAGIPVAITGAGSVARAGSRLSEYLNRTPQNVKTSGGNIRESISNVVNRANQPITNAFEQAQSRGFNPTDARVLSELKGVDKAVGREMLDLAEGFAEGTISPSTAKRPIDVVGKNVVEDITDLQKLQKTFGKEVDDVAESLRGSNIDISPLRESVKNVLDKYKITTKGKTVNFSQSDFALSKKAQKDIREAVEFINSPKKDAYDVHRIKKTLDVLISGSKQGEGLTGSAKSLVQELRRAADDFLDNRFETYNSANTKFAEIRGLLDEAETVLGKNIVESKASQRMRQIFSNSQNRSNIKDFMSKLDENRVKYNLPDRGNIYNQVYLAEKFEDMFGTQAITGLKGEVERAISGVRAVAEGLRDPIKGIGQVAGNIVETVAGQTPEARNQFIRNLLNQ